MTEDANNRDRSSDAAPEQWWARPSGALSRSSDTQPGAQTAPPSTPGQAGSGQAVSEPSVSGQAGSGQGGPGQAGQEEPGGPVTDPTGRDLRPAAGNGTAGGTDRSGRSDTSVYPAQSYGQPVAGQYGQPRPSFGYQQSTGSYPAGSYQGNSYGGYSGGGFGGGFGGGRPTAVLAPQPPDPHTGRAKRSTAVVATAVVLGLGAAFGAGYLGSQVGPSTNSAADSSLTQTTTSAPVAEKVPTGSVQTVANAVLPSVVSVIAANGQSMDEGSGVILSKDGQILTNNHVVAGAQQISVRFNDGSTATATLVGGDATDDLAVIKAKGVSGLTPAKLGSSGSLQVGQQVVAIGSPLGLSATVTSGIVSALNRPVRTQSEQQQQQQQPWGNQGQDQQGQPQSSGSADTVLNAIQTDAAINPGNSGGALVDMSGGVIGINSAIASMTDSSSGQAGNIGVGFAIPIDQAKRIADEIIKNGYATHAVLGASVQSASTADQLSSTGAQIASVTDGSAASKAGLKAGDVVTKVGSQSIESSDALVAAIRSQVPGGTVDLTYLRGSKTSTVKVTLGSAKSN
jgi:putative serine protease PepD